MVRWSHEGRLSREAPPLGAQAPPRDPTQDLGRGPQLRVWASGQTGSHRALSSPPPSVRPGSTLRPFLWSEDIAAGLWRGLSGITYAASSAHSRPRGWQASHTPPVQRSGWAGPFRPANLEASEGRGLAVLHCASQSVLPRWPTSSPSPGACSQQHAVEQLQSTQPECLSLMHGSPRVVCPCRDCSATKRNEALIDAVPGMRPSGGR